MSAYTIGQVAERSGFPATALRYYEGIGLVPPAGRTAAGYRLYDERTLTRLAFIARAKQLGCSLDEIIDLVGVWDGERCAPVQRRLHELVTAKLADADRQISELRTFTGQLRAAATQLSGEPVDGPCAADCACLHEASDVSVAALGATPVDVPIACSLAPGDQAARLDEWSQILVSASRRLPLPSGGVRVELADDVDVAALAELVAGEHACCAFFEFAITVDQRGVGLEVDAPADARELIVGLFGEPADRG